MNSIVWMYRCEPVYCCYQLFDQPMHQTERKIQARHIYWNDLNLVLTSKEQQKILQGIYFTVC